MVEAIEILPPSPRWILRTIAPASCGLIVPTSPCRAFEAEGYAALWLGPDEWLVIGEAPSTDADIVDVSSGFVAIAVEGDDVAALLNSACPLDLHPAEFPPGMCTRTVFGKAQIVLWRTAPNRFRIEVARSYASYVIGLLEQARDCLTALAVTV